MSPAEAASPRSIAVITPSKRVAATHRRDAPKWEHTLETSIGDNDPTTAESHRAPRRGIAHARNTRPPPVVLGLRTGCCPDPDRDGGSGHHLIRGNEYKTALDEDGNHLSTGMERGVPWIAI